MDLEFKHPTHINALAPARNADAKDLVAIAGEHSVDILQVTDTSCIRIASFHIGSRITALAWSPRSISPATSDRWYLEITAAAADFGLHLLTKSADKPETIFSFGGGLSGHHGKVNDMVFCGGWDEDGARLDDKMLMVWDLYPSTDVPSPYPSPSPEPDYAMSPSPSANPPQPTAYVIPFPHALTSIRAHPGTTKELLVGDEQGSIFLTDWRTDPEDEGDDGSLRHSSVIELIEPTALSTSIMGATKNRSASVDWRIDAIDLVGGVYGAKFALWDISKLRGGLPNVTGITFPHGGSLFRWCPTYPEHFAISSASPAKGAIINIHNCNFIHAPPTPLVIRPKPHYVSAFDFLSTGGIPKIAAAIGSSLLIFSIGVDS